MQAIDASTRAHLSNSQPKRLLGSLLPTVLVAAVVLGIAGVVSLTSFGSNDPKNAVGSVDASFTCPVQETTRFDAGNTDDSFLPELTDGREPAGEAAGAPRHEVAKHGGSVVLRLGNADGTLASVTTFHERAGASSGGTKYVATEVTKCSNAVGRRANKTVEPLLTPGLPRSSSDFTADDFPSGAVRVVDRLTYDVAGFAKRHTIWAHPCNNTVCLVSGSRTSTQIWARLRNRSTTPQDRTTQLADPDDVVGQAPAHRLYAIYDRQSHVRAVSWQGQDGQSTSVPLVDGGGWSGQLFLALVPLNDYRALTVHPEDRHGPVRRYTAEVR